MPANLGNSTYHEDYVPYKVDKPKMNTSNSNYHPNKEGLGEKESRYKSDFKPYD